MLRFLTCKKAWPPWLGLGAGLVVSALWANCSGAHESSPHTTAVVKHPVAKSTTNVPALLNAPIDSLPRQLGPAQVLPPTYEDGNAYAHLAPRATDSVRAFRKNNLLLIACYDVRSRQVHDLLLLGRHEDSLMRQGALRPNATDYLVLPVFRANRPGSLLGLRIVNTNQD